MQSQRHIGRISGCRIPQMRQAPSDSDSLCSACATGKEVKLDSAAVLLKTLENFGNEACYSSLFFVIQGTLVAL